MITNFQQRKNEVLAEYQKFQKSITDFSDLIKEAGLPDPKIQFQNSLTESKRKAENIKKDRFRLMVAGEAKSGKSTFINAYLGVELLPMDVKQCTSSIVEIKYGETFSLLATYADKRIIKITKEAEIKEFLKKNAALSDDYRDIPIPTINQDILVRYGQMSKTIPVNIPKHVIEDFLKNSAIQVANIHNIDNYNEKIRNYIMTKKDDWKNIIVKIEILFPFQDESLKGIEIIDSPGVCARGGVSEITSNYIENADAILFLKPISGQALESSEFNDFMKNASVERNKDTLFLVLTRATNVTPSDLQRLEDEAHRQFNQLNPTNIIIVDSKAELFANSFSNTDNIEKHILELNKSCQLDDFVKGVWFDAQNDEKLFIQKLKEKSNFTQINEALSVFGRKAHYIALSSLLSTISKIYTRIVGDLENHMARFNEKAIDPTELAKKIAEIKKDLEHINVQMYQGTDEIIHNYTGDNGIIRRKANNEVEDLKKKAFDIDPTNENSFNTLEKEVMKKIDTFKDLQKELQEDIVTQCNETLINISGESDISYTSLEPDFSSAIFKELVETTESEAQEIRNCTEGRTFQKTKQHSEYSRDKHFDIVKSSILERLDSIKNDLINNLISFSEKIRDLYLVELSKNASAKKSELNAIYEKKMNAEQIQEIIQKMRILKLSCEKLKVEVNKIQGGIDSYVQ